MWKIYNFIKNNFLLQPHQNQPLKNFVTKMHKRIDSLFKMKNSIFNFQFDIGCPQ